jgi:hypothetical protein
MTPKLPPAGGQKDGDRADKRRKIGIILDFRVKPSSDKMRSRACPCPTRAKHGTVHTFMANIGRLTPFYVHTAHPIVLPLPRFFWHTSCYPSAIAIWIATQRFHHVKQQ